MKTVSHSLAFAALTAVLVMTVLLPGRLCAQRPEAARPQPNSSTDAPTTRPGNVKPPIAINDVRLHAPPVGKPHGRISAGARGPQAGDNAAEVFLLAPMATGACSTPHPTLYWFLTADTDVDICFVIAEMPEKGTASPEPLLTKKYEGDQRAGLRVVDLALENKALKPEVQYQVTVVLPCPMEKKKNQNAPARPTVPGHDDDSLGIFSMGFIAYVPPPAQLASGARGRAYLDAGFGFDAIDAFIRDIAKAGKAAPEQLYRDLDGLVWDQHMFHDGPVGNGPSDKENKRFSKFDQWVRTADGMIDPGRSTAGNK